MMVKLFILKRCLFYQILPHQSRRKRSLSRPPGRFHWAVLQTWWETWWSWWDLVLHSSFPPGNHQTGSYLSTNTPKAMSLDVYSTWYYVSSSLSDLPKEASMSCRSSLSMNPSRFWSIMLKASLNSWICDWSNMANTFEVALCGLFLVVFPFARLLDMLMVIQV